MYDINNAVKLRFDPENCKCGIRLVKAVGIIGDTEEKLEFDSSNAMFNNNDFYYFEMMTVRYILNYQRIIMISL